MMTYLKVSRELAHAQKLAKLIEEFKVGECSLSDDPDKQSAYLYGFRSLASRFVGAVRLLDHEQFNALITTLNLKLEHLAEAYELEAELLPLVDAVKFADAESISELQDKKTRRRESTVFIDGKTLTELRSTKLPNLDITKLARICEELDDSYDRHNYIACLLLLRAALNHIPPVFGHTTFKEVAANSGRSLKKAFEMLEDGSRPIADLHTHATMRSKENLPTRAQVEPYRASFEVLLHEVISRGTPAS